VRLGKNSFRALAKKEKLLGAWDQGTAQGWMWRWPERLLNITANYITSPPLAGKKANNRCRIEIVQLCWLT